MKYKHTLLISLNGFVLVPINYTCVFCFERPNRAVTLITESSQIRFVGRKHERDMQNETEFLVDCFIDYLMTWYHVKIMLNVITWLCIATWNGKGGSDCPPVRGIINPLSDWRGRRKQRKFLRKSVTLARLKFGTPEVSYNVRPILLVHIPVCSLFVASLTASIPR
jgi:hypothetical protein